MTLHIYRIYSRRLICYIRKTIIFHAVDMLVFSIFQAGFSQFKAFSVLVTASPGRLPHLQSAFHEKVPAEGGGGGKGGRWCTV
jgi:hypothetical protein